MKKFILAAATVTIALMMAASSFGGQETSKVRLIVDGAESGLNLKWSEKQDRLLVESQAVSQYFGGETQVTGEGVEITCGEHKLSFVYGSEFYTMDGLGGRKIDCQAEYSDGKAYLPLRYICEAFGASVSYNGADKAVKVSTSSFSVPAEIEKYFKGLRVYDQSTVRIEGEKTVYIDPRRILGEPHDADIILITHTHNDHYEIDSIKRVMKPETVVYITADGVEQAKADGLVNVPAAEPGKSYSEQGIGFTAVPAYNIAPDRQNHKKEYSWVGYILNINGYTYYFAGDTDFIPDMRNITQHIDVAFLPIDGKYNMPADEAAEAANAIKPTVAVPYHYNNFTSEDSAERFVELLDKEIKGAIVAFKLK